VNYEWRLGLSDRAVLSPKLNCHSCEIVKQLAEACNACLDVVLSHRRHERATFDYMKLDQIVFCWFGGSSDSDAVSPWTVTYVEDESASSLECQRFKIQPATLTSVVAIVPNSRDDPSGVEST